MKRKLLFTIAIVLLVNISGIACASIRQGDVGQDVADIQSHLYRNGYTIPVDGTFGLITAQAVRDFQLTHGLDDSGIVDDDTFRVLTGRSEPVSRGDKTTSIARKLLSLAMHCTGVPYVFGGTQPNGFDCSGYVQYVFDALGIHLPRTADEQYFIGEGVEPDRLTAGDLVFFETYEPGASHVGIYLGNNQFVSACSSQGVSIASLDNEYWNSRYIGARRVIG